MALPKMVLPSDTMKAAPEYIVSVASVATKGKIPIRLISAPLTRPPSSPTASAASTAAQTGQPKVNSTAATTPASEAIAPTDRSKSPITITTVMVTATTISIASCWLMFSQLRAVIKVSGSITQKKSTIAAIPIRLP